MTRFLLAVVSASLVLGSLSFSQTSFAANTALATTEKSLGRSESFKYKDHTYMVSDRKSGLYLVRSPGGEEIQISTESTHGQSKISTVVTPSGIMTAFVDFGTAHGKMDVDRQIDLDAFEMEKAFVPAAMPYVENEEGKSISAVSVVERFSDDYRKEIESSNLSFTATDKSLIKDVVDTFTAKKKRNALILGEPGVGKSTIAEGVVQSLPRTWLVRRIDDSNIGSGISKSGEFGKRIKYMLAASKGVPIVWYIPELHAMRGVGTHSENSQDIFEMIKPYMLSGQLMLLSTDDQDSFDRNFGTDGAIGRRFVKFTINPHADKEALEKLKNWIMSNDVLGWDESTLVEAMRLSKKFNPIEQEPSRSTDLIEAVVRYRKDKKIAAGPITIAQVRSAAHSRYQVPDWMADSALAQDKLAFVEKYLSENLIGQHALKDAYYRMARSLLTGIGAEKGPLSTLFLAGPSSTGKTESAELYAKAMGLPFLKIEMGRIDGHNLSAEDVVQQIAEALLKNPFTVIVLDEIEKSYNPKAVTNALLTFLDSDTFTTYENVKNSSKLKPRKVVSRYATLICTSNLLSDFVKKMEGHKQLGFATEKVDTRAELMVAAADPEEVLSMLEQVGFNDFFLKRMHDFALTTNPTRAEFKEILALHLNRKLEITSKEKGKTFDMIDKDAFVEKLVQEMENRPFDGRKAMRVLFRRIDPLLSDAVWHKDYENAEAVNIASCKTDFEFLSAKAKAKAAK